MLVRGLEQYRAGEERLFGYFVGQVMKATGGNANPAQANENGSAGRPRATASSTGFLNLTIAGSFILIDCMQPTE